MRRLTAAWLLVLLSGGVFYAYAANRWSKYEREMQSPANDPPTPTKNPNSPSPAYATSRSIIADVTRPGASTPILRAPLHHRPSPLTRIYGRSIEHIVDVDSDEIFDWPWVYIVSGGDWVINESQAARLRKYFDRGGFLVVDDFHGEVEWDQFMEGMGQVYPDARIEDLENEHPIFHTVYDLSERLQVPGYQIVERGSMWERNNGIVPYWRAINDEKSRVQVAAFLNQDLGDAWEFSNDPAYPEEFASMAYRMGVNYVVYSMTH